MGQRDGGSKKTLRREKEAEWTQVCVRAQAMFQNLWYRKGYWRSAVTSEQSGVRQVRMGLGRREQSEDNRKHPQGLLTKGSRDTP